MFRTISAASRLCRIATNIYARALPVTPTCINIVRFKYQNRGGDGKKGSRKDAATSYDDEVDTIDSPDSDSSDHNMLEDK